MAHDVSFSIPPRRLGRADVEFDVSKDGSKLGTLKVSNGAIVRTPVNKQRGHKIYRSEFDKFAQKRTRME